MKSAFSSAVILYALVATSGSALARHDQAPSPVATATPVPSASAASPVPSAVPSVLGTQPAQSDSKATARAREWLGRLQKADVDRSQLTGDLSAGLEDATVHAIAKQLAPLGTPQNFALRGKHDTNGVTTWVFRVSWPRKVLDYTFGLEDQSGRIAALYLRPGTA